MAIEMTVYYYADSCSAPRGICSQYFHSPRKAKEFLMEQGYIQMAVNEYQQRGSRGDIYRAILVDTRPANDTTRKDWRRICVR